MGSGKRETSYKRHARWREKNREKMRSNWKRWASTERGSQLRKIGIAKWKGSNSILYFRNRYILTVIKKNPCALCDSPYKRGFVVDHINPRGIGGGHEIENLQVLCKKCNLEKTKKDISLVAEFKRNLKNKRSGSSPGDFKGLVSQ